MHSWNIGIELRLKGFSWLLFFHFAQRIIFTLFVFQTDTRREVTSLRHLFCRERMKMFALRIVMDDLCRGSAFH